MTLVGQKRDQGRWEQGVLASTVPFYFLSSGPKSPVCLLRGGLCPCGPESKLNHFG